MNPPYNPPKKSFSNIKNYIKKLSKYLVLTIVLQLLVSSTNHFWPLFAPTYVYADDEQEKVIIDEANKYAERILDDFLRKTFWVIQSGNGPEQLIKNRFFIKKVLKDLYKFQQQAFDKEIHDKELNRWNYSYYFGSIKEMVQRQKYILGVLSLFETILNQIRHEHFSVKTRNVVFNLLKASLLVNRRKIKVDYNDRYAFVGDIESDLKTIKKNFMGQKFVLDPNLEHFSEKLLQKSIQNTAWGYFIFSEVFHQGPRDKRFKRQKRNYDEYQKDFYYYRQDHNSSEYYYDDFKDNL